METFHHKKGKSKFLVEIDAKVKLNLEFSDVSKICAFYQHQRARTIRPSTIGFNVGKLRTEIWSRDQFGL